MSSRVIEDAIGWLSVAIMASLAYAVQGFFAVPITASLGCFLVYTVLLLSGRDAVRFLRAAYVLLILCFMVFGSVFFGPAGLILGFIAGVLIIAYGYAYARLIEGMGRPRPPTGPGSELIGQRATVVSHVEAGIWVRIADAEWPARLPPFTPRPSPGASVSVEYAAEGILVVRPDA